MRLSEFIDSCQEAIIAESVRFAEKIPVLSGSTVALDVLRDHLPLVLADIARDLEREQSRRESILKSEGRAPQPKGDTAAEMHGKFRAVSGLNVEQLVAEFRVLRSSVLRLWSEAYSPDTFNAQDVFRFNEAVDQALAESVAFFHAEVEHWRSLLLGIVGHDLRGPLNAMLLVSEVLVHEAGNSPLASHADRISRNAKRMSTLLDSLLEYNKASLGTGMTLNLADGDLVYACADELAIVRASLPGRVISFTSPPTCYLKLDFSRVREALANLVFNAAHHGIPGCAIEVGLERSPSGVRLSVTNDSGPIEAARLQGLFEPLRPRTLDRRSGRESRNLGLGLFIVRTIARAHGGEASAEILDGRITFCLNFPVP